jgi:hypothetical protein
MQDMNNLFPISLLIRHECCINPLPVLFKALLHGQEDRVFFTGHLNLHTTPEIGLTTKKKNHNN